MSEDVVKIVIPTHGRAGRVTTFRVFPSAILCVTKSQVGQYREHYPDAEIVEHPDEVIGLAPKRQWILDKFGSVFQTDDDVTAMVRMYTAPGESNQKVQGEQAEQIVQRLAWLAKQGGFYLFGLSPFEDITKFNVFKPFRVTGWVNAHAMGIMEGSQIYFRPDLSLVDDFWVSCMNAFHHRKALIDMRYGLMHKDTFHNEGGLANWRTVEACRKAYVELETAFGSDVIKKKKLKTITHEWQPMMTLPF